MTTPTTGSRTAHRLARWSVRLVLLAFVTLVVGALAVVIALPRATHGEAMTVLTGSMSPKIPVGSVVLVRPVDPSSLEVGDIATYQPKADLDEYITHRIVKIDDSTNPTTFTFKGDANRGPDINPVSARQIRGKVWFHVPYLGAIRDGLHGQGGLSLVAMLLLGGYALSQLSGAWSDRLHPPPSPPPTVSSEVDRDLIVATFDIAPLLLQHSLTAERLVDMWSAVLLEQRPTEFRLLIAPPAGGTAAALELLQQFQAREVTLHTGTVTLASIAHEHPPIPLPREATRAPS